MYFQYCVMMTALHGTGKLALQSPNIDVSELRRRVTSPNGTTQAAIEHLQSKEWKTITEVKRLY